MYKEGRGVAQNDQEAARWYRKAAEQDDATAQFFLGWMYKEGRGVAQNGQEAVRWYRKAAEQGHTEAAIKLSHMNSIWYDESTNLTWMRCSLGQTWDGTTCVGTAQKYIWEKAQQAVAEMNRNGGYAGYTDWLVPDIEALQSLLRDHGRVPKIDHAIFPNTPDRFYWSASSGAHNNRYAWGVNFGHGYMGSSYKNYSYRVRAVRAGQ